MTHDERAWLQGQRGLALIANQHTRGPAREPAARGATTNAAGRDCCPSGIARPVVPLWRAAKRLGAVVRARAYVRVDVGDTGGATVLPSRWSRLVPGRERPVCAVSAHLARSGASVPGLWVAVELICDRGRLGAPDCRQLWNLPRPDTSR
jgi:hypothetical protein